MSDETLLQQFVDSFERLDEMEVWDDAPAEMIVQPPQEDWDSWRTRAKWRPVRTDSDRTLLDPLYKKIPGRLPELYERLVLTYRWLDVDLDVILLLANPCGSDLTGLTNQFFWDPVLASVLIPKGYVPFARSLVCYDPICFDTSSMTPAGDCPILQFEHESILCHDKIGEKTQLWNSFRDLVTAVVFME